MNVAIILGRGVEGCGVSKMAIEQARWFEKNGHGCTIFANTDKNWSRRESHDFGTLNFKPGKFSQNDTISKMLETCNNTDFVIVDSVPSKGHKEESIKNYVSFINQLTVPIVFIQLDHSIHSIVRNAGMMETVNKSDVIFSFGVDNDFARKIKKETAKTGKEFTKKILTYSVGFPFLDVKKKYWKPIEQQDPKAHKWIGRCSGWKGYKLMFDFHNAYLKPGGHLTSFEGIERSPHYLTFKQASTFHYQLKDNPSVTPMKHGTDAYVFGIYNNDEMLERMSQTGFGYQLSTLKPRFITNQIEYTHCEIVAAGAIPVFRKSWGDCAMHRTTGDPLSECKNTGTLWLSEDNFQPIFEKIDKLSKDPIMRNEWRNMAFDFYQNHQDSSHVLKDMFDKITNEIKGSKQ